MPTNPESMFFSTLNNTEGVGELPLEIVMFDLKDDWSILESGVLVADNTGSHHPSVRVDASHFRRVIVYFEDTENNSKCYEVIHSLKPDAISKSLTIKCTSSAAYAPDVAGSVDVIQFGTKVFNPIFNLPNINLTVPEFLPSNIKSLDLTFSNCDLFNQDISMWDVSNVKVMSATFSESYKFNQPIGIWDTSNVEDMGYMFALGADFNQDLSGWCVAKIPTPPNGFDLGMSLWTLPKPVWGTCPRGENLPA